MARYTTVGPVIDHIEEGYDSLYEFALDFLKNYDFGECKEEIQNISYAEYKASWKGVHMYYCYAGDYYFFAKAF